MVQSEEKLLCFSYLHVTVAECINFYVIYFNGLAVRDVCNISCQERLELVWFQIQIIHLKKLHFNILTDSKKYKEGKQES